MYDVEPNEETTKPIGFETESTGYFKELVEINDEPVEEHKRN